MWYVKGTAKDRTVCTKGRRKGRAAVALNKTLDKNFLITKQIPKLGEPGS